MGKSWHALSVEDTFKEFQTGNNGLSPEEAPARLGKYGYNEIERKKETSAILIFLRQFASPLIYILIAAAVFSAAIRHFLDAAVISIVLFINAVIGFIQETRAEKAMQALLEMAAPKANVMRGGEFHEIPAREIVPGDILLLETGDKVPADLRLVSATNLKVNESALTGESLPVDKDTRVLEADTAVADRTNTAYLGTVVTYGRGTGVAVATGMATEIGKIAESIEKVVEEPTPLQKSIDQFGRYVISLFTGILAVIIAVGVLRGLELFDMFLLAVAAAVSAIPEGLPAAVTVILAIGMRLMAERHAIIRKLIAVETLGSATVICTDKTGTLTLNQMTVREVRVNGSSIGVTGEGYNPVGEFLSGNKSLNPDEMPSLKKLLTIGLLCNDAILRKNDGRFNIFGDPTEGALLVAAEKAGLDKLGLERASPRLDELPFQSEKQYMATLNKNEDGRVVYVKGATEKLLNMSRFILKNGEVVPLGDGDKHQIMEANVEMAKKALRVIAAAYKEFPPGKEKFSEDDIKELVFAGIVGMADPPREEARKAIGQAGEAGLRVVMITGDHKITAESIARELEIPAGRTVTGAELKEIDDDTLCREIEHMSVFARIEPLQKLRIVNAFRKNGEVVAMTGDGVNDAPALRAADIGIAMGITGTDVAKESGDMVLADDNFASIVAAVEEGRAIFDRLRNVIFFLISTNLSELLTLMLSLLLLGETPILPVQILWVNLVTDTAGAVPLGFEPKSGNELKEPPRNPKVGLIFPGLLIRMALASLFMGAGTFLLFRWEANRVSLEEARTVAFCAMVTYQWFAAFYARSDEVSVFKKGLFSNRYLLLFISVAVFLQLAVCYIPFLQSAFDTVALSASQWGRIFAATASFFILEELRKTFFPRLFSLGKLEPWRMKKAKD